MSEFLQSNGFLLAKFIIWLIITLLAIALLVIKSIFKKFNWNTDSIQRMIDMLDRERLNIMKNDSKKLHKDIKKGKDINKEKAKKLLDDLYKAVADKDENNKNDKEQPK